MRTAHCLYLNVQSSIHLEFGFNRIICAAAMVWNGTHGFDSNQSLKGISTWFSAVLFRTDKTTPWRMYCALSSFNGIKNARRCFFCKNVPLAHRLSPYPYLPILNYEWLSRWKMVFDRKKNRNRLIKYISFSWPNKCPRAPYRIWIPNNS